MEKSWWLHIYHTTDVHSSQAHHLPNCPWLCLLQLFFPICTHWVRFQLGDKEAFIFHSSGATEVSWASDKGCHIPKKSSETKPMAITWKGVIDELLVTPLLQAHGALPQKGWCTWGILARTPCTDCERTWKSLSCDVSMLVKAGGVCGQSLSTGTVECWMLPRQAEIFYCH